MATVPLSARFLHKVTIGALNGLFDNSNHEVMSDSSVQLEFLDTTTSLCSLQFVLVSFLLF